MKPQSGEDTKSTQPSRPQEPPSHPLSTPPVSEFDGHPIYNDTDKGKSK